MCRIERAVALIDRVRWVSARTMPASVQNPYESDWNHQDSAPSQNQSLRKSHQALRALDKVGQWMNAVASFISSGIAYAQSGAVNTRQLSRDEKQCQYTHGDRDLYPMPPVSVIILCYNEEINVKDCLESCAWCDDVHVLDSGSKDATVAIAESMGAKVWVNPFKSFGQQRNWAIDNITTKHRWHFHLDADERFTPALVAEMQSVLDSRSAISDETTVTAYQCPSMLMFMGQWLRHAAEYPVYQVRFFDSQWCRYEDFGHGQRELNRGKTAYLKMPYIHHNFSKGIDDWVEKHNRYSTLESKQALECPRMSFMSAIRGCFAGDAIARRRHLKSLSYSVPAKSTMMFLYIAIIRRGFLDGKAGINYARMRALYCSMISLKSAYFRAEREHDSSNR